MRIERMGAQLPLPAEGRSGHQRIALEGLDVLTDEVRSRLAVIRNKISDAGGDVSRITIVAVTKGFGLVAVRAALGAGLVNIGENYAAELIHKAGELNGLDGSACPRWHFIGAVQRRRVAALGKYVDCWQSVARVSEGAAIARYRPGARVFVQVNAARMEGRNGCLPEDACDLVKELRGLGLRVDGLMTIGIQGDTIATHNIFSEVRDLVDRLEVAEVSIGMTEDLETAVRAGSTMVRIGRGLFGNRETIHHSVT
ncbi:MAG: alanine racemase [Actinobacteria bacterium]|nr:alanine racemase [Actinomycetota bacterium]MCL5446380.1 alanine racemase [Actinomycetota bacterium]